MNFCRPYKLHTLVKNACSYTVFIFSRFPLRNARRKSTAVKRTAGADDEDFLDSMESSPNNSITSVNSLASLLKEKMQVNNLFFLQFS